MSGHPQPSVFAGQPALLRDLFERSAASKFGLTEAEFAAALNQIAGQYLRPGSSKSEARKLFASLRLEELALARACVAGHEVAWTEFLNRYREPLYQAAYAICRDDVRGRELADSLYADLYGIRRRESGAAGPERASKLASYTGRGSLAGWLRSVLAQEHVNLYRQQRRLVSLEEQTELGKQFAAAVPAPAPASDPRLSSATGKAIADLDAESRFLLAEYYLDGRSLAEIARALGVHESTISRKLQRVAKDLRRDIKRDLVRSGMSGRAAEEALEADVRDLEINVRQLLRNAHNNAQKSVPPPTGPESLQESAARSFHAGEGEK
jgi:RNA polymerase sigma-70 factor (ECF subfamily)